MEVDVVAVLVAALASFVVGFIWYMPAVFGKAWMEMSGVTMPTGDEKKGMGATMLAGLVAQLVMASVLGWFMGATGASGAVGGMETAAWLWLGFVATIGLGSVLWERRPLKLYVLNMAHWLVALVVMGAVLGAMM